MTTGAILVVLTQPASAAACLRAAAQAVRALPGALIQVLHIRPDPARTIMTTEEVLPEARRAAIESEESNTAGALRAAFDAWHGSTPAATWLQIAGTPATELLTRTANAALLVMGQPGAHPHHLDREAFDAAIFHSGKPVLVAPPGWSGTFGTHLAIGWRDTETTRRAVQATQPWLAAAARITVIEVGDDSAKTTIQALSGLTAAIDHRVVQADGRTDAETLLTAASAAGADGLVMGAYRRGRLLEWVLGGVTEHVLRHTELPVLLSH